MSAALPCEVALDRVDCGSKRKRHMFRMSRIAMIGFKLINKTAYDIDIELGIGRISKCAERQYLNKFALSVHLAYQGLDDGLKFANLIITGDRADRDHPRFSHIRVGNAARVGDL